MAKRDNWCQYFKFGLVGISNTIIGLLSYYLFLWLGFYYMTANVFSWIISVYNAFYWNNKYVFKNNISWWIALIKTYISYGLSFLSSMFLLYILVEYACVSEFLAPVITLLMTIPMNFLMNKYWTFK